MQTIPNQTTPKMNLKIGCNNMLFNRKSKLAGLILLGHSRMLGNHHRRVAPIDLNSPMSWDRIRAVDRSKIRKRQDIFQIIQERERSRWIYSSKDQAKLRIIKRKIRVRGHKLIIMIFRRSTFITNSSNYLNNFITHHKKAMECDKILVTPKDY